MHIPDGFLDLKTSAAAAAFATAGLALALRRCRYLPQRRVPLLGLGAAFIFAAQMLNFPIPGGTSGHLIGGTLAAILLGPSAAIVSLSAVLIVQCLAFADGGLLALGANIFNLAILHPLAGYALYKLLSRPFPTGPMNLAAAALAAWLATILTSLACAGQLALSNRVPWPLAAGALAAIHALIGLGEAIITAMVLSTLRQTRPDLLQPTAPDSHAPRPLWPTIAYGLLLTLGLTTFIAPFASPLPDGLDKAAHALGLADAAKDSPLPTPAPDYTFPILNNAPLATALAGGVGTVLVFGTIYLMGRVVGKRPAGGAVEQSRG